MREIEFRDRKADILKKYRESPKGTLTNMYDKMRSRNSVEFTLKQFHDMFLEDKKYLRIHKEWILSGKNKKKKPSIDRISNKIGYTFKNIHMVTWEENRYKQTMERRSRKGRVAQLLDGIVVKIYKSQRDLCLQTGFSQGNVSMCLNSKINTVFGYTFKYIDINHNNVTENPELLK